MSYLVENDFSSYNLTDQEVIEGSIFTITQAQVMQNQLAAIAMEKNALEFDTANPQFFIQQEASLKGQLDILRHLLDTSRALQEPEVNADTDDLEINPEL